MKIWIESIDWPWPVEKYRYPMEQMLITLFPGEKFEFLYLSPDDEMEPLREGDMKISFEWIEPPAGSTRKEMGSISAEVNVGPDLQEAPKDDPWSQEWISTLMGGSHCLGLPIFPKKLGETDDDAYRYISQRVKSVIHWAGSKMLRFSETKQTVSLPWGTLTGVRPVKLPTRAMQEGKTPEEAERELREEYYVDEYQAKLAVECALTAVDVYKTLKPDGIALYIGIPFCPTRCAYCSFISSNVKASLALVEPYVDRLCQEIKLAGTLLREKGFHISCAYMGGGTPTTLSAEQLHRVLSAVEKHLPMERCTEFTVEAGRPDTITAEKLKVLKDHRIHRISINPQTMNDQVLQEIGRSHTAAQIEEAMALAKDHFGGMVNMDLIAGLPTDTVEGFQGTLDRVLAMDPANITVHTLALKKGSRLSEEGGNPCTPETVKAMLALASERLREAGYAPYYLYRQKYMTGAFENVGWAKPGTKCIYNVVMMEEMQTVLALGAGGITKLADEYGSMCGRLSNPKYAKEYLESWDKVAANKREAVEFQAELNR